MPKELIHENGQQSCARLLPGEIQQRMLCRLDPCWQVLRKQMFNQVTFIQQYLQPIEPRFSWWPGDLSHGSWNKCRVLPFSPSSTHWDVSSQCWSLAAILQLSLLPFLNAASKMSTIERAHHNNQWCILESAFMCSLLLKPHLFCLLFSP